MYYHTEIYDFYWICKKCGAPNKNGCTDPDDFYYCTTCKQPDFIGEELNNPYSEEITKFYQNKI